MHSYEFLTNSWRAQPLYVVDGDTVDLFVDVGFMHYATHRFRFLDVDTPEMNAKDEDDRAKAKEAKQFVQDLLDSFEKTFTVDLKYWPLRIETAKNPDSFGRWLCRVFFTADDIEISVNAELLKADLAVLYEDR